MPSPCKTKYDITKDFRKVTDTWVAQCKHTDGSDEVVSVSNFVSHPPKTPAELDRSKHYKIRSTKWTEDKSTLIYKVFVGRLEENEQKLKDKISASRISWPILEVRDSDVVSDNDGSNVPKTSNFAPLKPAELQKLKRKAEAGTSARLAAFVQSSTITLEPAGKKRSSKTAEGASTPTTIKKAKSVPNKTVDSSKHDKAKLPQNNSIETSIVTKSSEPSNVNAPSATSASHGQFNNSNLLLGGKPKILTSVVTKSSEPANVNAPSATSASHGQFNNSNLLPGGKPKILTSIVTKSSEPATVNAPSATSASHGQFNNSNLLLDGKPKILTSIVTKASKPANVNAPFTSSASHGQFNNSNSVLNSSLLSENSLGLPDLDFSLNNTSLLIDEALDIESGGSGMTVLASIPLKSPIQPSADGAMVYQPQPSFDSAFHSVTSNGDDEKLKRMEQELNHYKGLALANSETQVVATLMSHISSLKEDISGISTEMRNFSSRLQIVERELPSDPIHLKVARWLDGCDFASSSQPSYFL